MSAEFGRRDLAVIAGLLGACALAYAQVAQFAFLTGWDDPGYVTDNAHVRQGLTAGNLAWAMTSVDMANWHPLTWLSHMLDVELFGLDAGAHHLVSVALHALACILLYAFLRTAADGEWWRAALAAGLFAVHPLHVESVAWISERKDVLSGALWMLALIAYVAYARRPGLPRYAALAAVFALGLMAKPMLVTLPFVLLLLDLWPLRRASPARADLGRWTALVAEKLPLFALAAGSAAVTMMAQSSGEAVVPLGAERFADRIANALIAYGTYLRMALAPYGLSFFYPFRADWSAGALLLSAGALSALSAWSVATVRLRPQRLVGWLWFLGTLVPVIGLVRVGDQAMADRYMYLPIAGLLIMATWSLPSPTRTAGRRALAAGAAGALVAATFLSARQVEAWRDSEALARKALATDPRNHVAHTLLAGALLRKRDLAGAHDHAAEARRLAGQGTFARFAELALGEVAAAQGRLPDAARHFAEAVRIAPRFAVAQFKLGTTALDLGDPARAVGPLEQAARLDPGMVDARLNLGVAFAQLGRLADAEVALADAARLAPGRTDVRLNLAQARELLGATAEAERDYREVLAAEPGNAAARLKLARLLASTGRRDAALEQVGAALRTDPGNSQARAMMARLRESTREGLAK